MKALGKTISEITDNIREKILNKSLQPGDLLPPVRVLAMTLGVNRNTVATVYQRLATAGLVMTQGRRGTIVCAPPQQAAEQEGFAPSSDLFDLADGNPNPKWLPTLSSIQLDSSFKTYLYGDDTVLPELRAWADRWFQEDCSQPYEIELTHGAVDAIERLAAAYLAVGDQVVVEDPCFLGAINSLRLAGVKPLSVAVDHYGMCPSSLKKALEAGALAVLITPRNHNPTGCSLTKQRAEAIKKVLADYPHVLIIIDDHFALLTTENYYSAIPESTQQWALVRSVSKALGPDLRLAIIACDSNTASRLRARLAAGLNWVSHILQKICYLYLTSETVLKGIEQAKSDYRKRYQNLCDALNTEGIPYTQGAGGLNVWIPLPITKKTEAVIQSLAKHGWLVRSGQSFQVEKNIEAIRITISKLDKQQAVQLAKDIKKSVSD